MEESGYVLQRRVAGAMVVSATHPVIGPLYWYFCSNADCNAPDYYGLTRFIDNALRVRGDWRQNERVASYRHNFLAGLDEAYNLARAHDYPLRDIGQWVASADWQSTPAPDQLRWLQDRNGFVGYMPIWTDNPDEALRYHRSDDENAREDAHLGDFVPIEEARSAYEQYRAVAIPPWQTDRYPFGIVITEVGEDPDYRWFTVRFVVSGEPTEAEVANLLFDILVARRRCQDDDDRDAELDTWWEYDHRRRTGYWASGSKAEPLRRKVGQTYWGITRNRDIWLGSDVLRRLAVGRALAGVDPAGSAALITEAQNMARAMAYRVGRNAQIPPLIAGESLLAHAWKNGCTAHGGR